MERRSLFLIVTVGFTLLKRPIDASQQEEPVCTSRFDYDHKMLQKMLMMEMEQRKDKIIMEEIKSALFKQKDGSSKDRSVLESIDGRIRKLETFRPLDESGSTYVRWGRTQCQDNGTELVYKGYAGGSHYTNKGGSSTYLCLPEEPLWNVYEDEEQSSATVWGAEYELHERNMNKFFGKTLLNHDVPCCVCRTKRASVLLIPGRNKCYDGWTLEYEGYLSGGHDTYHASEFICLDARPEIIDDSASNADGKLFYFVEARCGSLRCPPYVNGRELTCVVCSK